ncbi:hypothetical protein CLF_102805 [Clonorchis sinensis]|uniref:Uncharacterized protein n=1 Tax=Clonorchis sinensis TaxID=79923 RepID=H2KPY8_CLOSI|nr:hypothetical protein CLF_102805 [Clonorchis sinensis]
MELASYRSIQPIASLLAPDATYDLSDPAKASVLIGTLASETSQLMDCRNQFLIYNAPDRIPTERTKVAILTACNMYAKVCTARQLRKLKRFLCCPTLKRLRDKNDTPCAALSVRLLKSVPKHTHYVLENPRVHEDRWLSLTLIRFHNDVHPL